METDVDIEILVGDKGLDEIAEQMRESANSSALATVGNDVIGDAARNAINEKLNSDGIFGLLAKAWTEAAELADFGDPQKHPHPFEAEVELVEHSISQDLHPQLKLVIAGFEFQPIRFTVEFEADFSGICLLIKDGQLTGIKSGHCELSATLKHGDQKLHSEKITKEPIDFTKPYYFKRGPITIPNLTAIGKDEATPTGYAPPPLR